MSGLNNLIFFLILFVIYIINTQKNYKKTKNELSESQEKKIDLVIKAGLVIAACIFVFSIVRYIILKKREYKQDFSIGKFFTGTTTCKKNSPIDNWGFISDNIKHPHIQRTPV